MRESYVKKTGEGLGAALTGLDFSDILGQKNSKGKKNGEFLEETFFEMEYDGYRIAICGEKDSKPEFVVYRGTIDNCFLSANNPCKYPLLKMEHYHSQFFSSVQDQQYDSLLKEAVQ